MPSRRLVVGALPLALGAAATAAVPVACFGRIAPTPDDGGPFDAAAAEASDADDDASRLNDGRGPAPVPSCVGQRPVRDDRSSGLRVQAPLVRGGPPVQHDLRKRLRRPSDLRRLQRRNPVQRALLLLPARHGVGWGGDVRMRAAEAVPARLGMGRRPMQVPERAVTGGALESSTRRRGR